MQSQAKVSRQFSQRIAFGLLVLATVVVVIPVLLIIATIIVSGSGAITWEFLSQHPTDAGRAGGILPAIVGTLYLMLGTVIFSVPVGVLAAIYLSEYARANWLTRLINLAIVNLAGVPSIVYGLFGLAAFVMAMDLGRSLLAASLTLACQSLAMTITTSRESIQAVPSEFRRGSLAIGATRWQTLRHLILPQAMPGIVTGSILAVGRAAGETASILVVGAAFFLPGLPHSPFDQFMALSYHLFMVAAHVPGVPMSAMWGIALVLLVIVLSFNFAAIVIRLRARHRRYGS